MSNEQKRNDHVAPIVIAAHPGFERLPLIGWSMRFTDSALLPEIVPLTPAKVTYLHTPEWPYWNLHQLSEFGAWPSQHCAL